LAEDPPPDLVVEVDFTHTDIDKNRLYAAMGVPEFWRYNGREWRIYQLQGESYVECVGEALRMQHRSPTFSWVEKQYLYDFLELAQEDEMAAQKAFKELVKEQVK